MAELRFVQTMDTDITDKLDSQVSSAADDLRIEIDMLISRSGTDAVECIMVEIKEESGWDLDANESAYSELQTEYEERMRNSLGLSCY